MDQLNLDLRRTLVVLHQRPTRAVGSAPRAGHVLVWLRDGCPATMVPFAATVIPDLLAAADRNPAFPAGLHDHVAGDLAQPVPRSSDLVKRLTAS